MSDWVDVPEFPEYEISLSGRIRHKETGYYPRAEYDYTAKIHYVNLWNTETGRLETVMVDYLLQKVEAYKKMAELKDYAKANLKAVDEEIEKMFNKAVIDNEWVVLGEFPDYEIHRNGDIRNIFTNKVVEPRNGKQGPRVELWHRGMKHQKAVMSLLREAFPNSTRKE